MEGLYRVRIATLSRRWIFALTNWGALVDRWCQQRVAEPTALAQHEEGADRPADDECAGLRGVAQLQPDAQQRQVDVRPCPHDG